MDIVFRRMLMPSKVETAGNADTAGSSLMPTFSTPRKQCLVDRHPRILILREACESPSDARQGAHLEPRHTQHSV
jgi:hypothetical protein